MPRIRKICVITGSRADYGLLYWLIKAISNDSSLQLQLIATGMHLSPEFGLTYSQIVKDGFEIDYKVHMLLNSDKSVATSKSMGLGIIGFAEAYQAIEPDLIVVLGDRFEIFSAVSSAMTFRIPIAHIHGGETSEGAYDELIRHSITKMSHLHFTSTESYRKRVIQLGEQPRNVFNVGAPGIDSINRLKLLTLDEFEKSIDFKLNERNLLVTFHPVTLENSSAEQQFSCLLKVLDSLQNTHILFTKSNADTGGRIINQMIDNFVSLNVNKAISFNSLGQLKYLSAMKHVDGVIGNSSSGLIEAPSFKIGTVNIGDRQKGRIRADSVIDCVPNFESINKAILELYNNKFSKELTSVVNPYGDGFSSEKIFKIIKSFSYDGLIKKTFYDVVGEIE